MFTWLLYNTLCALPLALVALLLRRVPTATARVEHLAWLLVFVRLVLPPLPELGAAAASASTLPAVFSSAPSLGDQAVAWMTRNFGNDWSTGLTRGAAVLFVGLLAAFLVRELRRVLSIDRRLRRHGLPDEGLQRRVAVTADRLGLRTPNVRVLPGSPTPFVWSLRRPLLVMPDVPEPPSATVVAHELAHLRRRDHWIAWLELVVFVLHFWNPLFWFARRRLHLAAEMACDEEVVQRFPSERQGYARALLEAVERAATWRPLPRAVHAIGSDVRDFELRLRRIVSGPRPRRAGRVAVLAIAAVGLATLPGLAAPSLASFRARLPALPAGLDRSALESMLERAQERLDLDPTDGRAHDLHGRALLGLGRAREAVEAFVLQAEQGYEVAKAFYNQACAHVCAGNPDEAVRCLEAAEARGLAVSEFASRDPDLASLRGRADFARLIRR